MTQSSIQFHAWKDIERSFGVLQRKLQLLNPPFKQWSEDDIHDIIMTCVILHNAMVTVRIDQNEEESNDFYDNLDLVDCSVALNQEEVEVVEVAQCRSDFWATCLLQNDQANEMLDKNPAYNRAMLSFQVYVALQCWHSFEWQGCSQFTAPSNHISAGKLPNEPRWIKKEEINNN